MAAGSIIIDLLMKTGSFETDTKRAEKRLKEFDATAKAWGKGIAASAAAAGTALGFMVKQSIDSMDQLAKQAQMVGTTTESLSGLSYAAELAGVSQETLVGSMAKLSKGMSDAAQNTGEALKAFQALQLDPKQFSGTDEALLQIAERFEGLADGSEKTALAMALFGRSGAQLIPLLNAGRNGITELTDEARKFGIVIGTDSAKAAEEFNDNITRMQTLFKGLVTELTVAVLPALNQVLETLLETSKAFKDQNLSQFFTGGILETGQLKTAEENVTQLKDSIAKLQAQIDIGKGGIFVESSLAAQVELLRRAELLVQSLRGQVPVEVPDFDTGFYAADFPKAKPKAPMMSTKDPQADKLKNMLETVKKISDEFNRSQQYQLEMMKNQEAMLGMTRDQQTVQNAVNTVLNSTNSQLEKIASQRLDAANAGANAQILAQFDAESEMIQELGDAWAELARIQAQSSVEAQRTFAFGWNTALAQFVEDSTNAATVAADMFSSLTNNMGNAIANFVETGKLSFGDLTRSIIKDLIRIQLQAQVSRVFGMIAGSIGSAIGNVSTAVTYGTDVGSQQTAMLQAQEAGFAGGGFTGMGGKYEPAGIVHRGEYVLNAETTKKLGVGFLDRINKGYANGGYVGNPPPAGNGSNVQVNVINQSSQPVQAQQSAPRFDGVRFVQDIILTDLRRNGPIGQALRTA